ncbi:unnamed protein product, partial [marine sediment metagenome]
MSSRSDQKIFTQPLFKVYMDDKVPTNVGEVLMSGKISQYNKISEFESVLSKYIGSDKILTINSGTNALHLAYHLL